MPSDYSYLCSLVRAGLITGTCPMTTSKADLETSTEVESPTDLRGLAKANQTVDLESPTEVASPTDSCGHVSISSS